ncbi:MAG: hypothetical protein Q9199_000781 [Rusavskia elegans]
MTLKNPLRVVCISDTHDLQPLLPYGDLLLHVGDLTGRGTFGQLQIQLDWLNKQSHRYKVVIAGNKGPGLEHKEYPGRLDRNSGQERKDLNWGSLIYLQSESATLEFPSGRKLKVYGSPWTSQFGTWAFQYPPIRDVFYTTVPPGTDIFLTHGPPKYHLDLVNARGHQGCPHLAREVWRSHDALKLVVFGHIHEGHGREDSPFDRSQQLREEILLGLSGLISFVELALRLLFERLSLLLSSERSPEFGKQRGVTLVNAAIATRPWEKDSKVPIVVEI